MERTISGMKDGSAPQAPQRRKGIEVVPFGEFRLYICELLIRFIMKIVPRKLPAGRMLLVCLVSYLCNQLKWVNGEDSQASLVRDAAQGG